MSPDTEAYDLTALADRAGVSQRTVRYYIQQGLLPSPETRGPGAHYSARHLDRLRLIRWLQREHLPLAEIRRRLETIGPADIRKLLKREREKPGTDAKDYIRKVLAAGQRRIEGPPRGLVADPLPLTLRLQELPRLEEALRAAEPPATKPPARSQWDRIALTPDVELHVRRPLSREQNRQVERLLDAARIILEEQP